MDSVSVQAETLHEAVALAVRELRAHDCPPGTASEMEVEARSRITRQTTTDPQVVR
jgi:hypothetical protein